MIRCLIVDDKPLAIEILNEYIKKISFLETVHTAQNPLEALQFAGKNQVDLVFLDIQMPELNGLQFMKLIDKNTRVIITTAYTDYALQGYEYNVIDYLLKPVAFDRFYMAVEKARILLEDIPGKVVPIPTKSMIPEPDCLFVKTSYKIQKIALADILFIEAKQNYISIFTTEGMIMTLQNIKTIEEKLPATQFIRVHKSYIVSINKINTIEKSRIMIGTNIVPIGDSYRDTFFRMLGT